MGALDGTVTLPAIGDVQKKYLLLAGAGVGGYVAYRWWTAGQVPEEEGVAPPEESMGTIGADIGSGSGGYYGTGSAASDTDTTGGTAITTNSAWYQAAVDYLEGLGRDRGTAAAALGKYLDKKPLTAAEQQLVQMALGAYGQPPTGGPWTLIVDNSPDPSTTPAPRGLRVVKTGPTQVDLAWDPVAGASGYRVYRGLGENIGHSVDTNFSVRGLNQNTTYTFMVRAINSAGSTGGDSNKVKAKTTTNKLPAPTGVKSTTSPSTVHLSWKPVTGAKGYRVEYTPGGHSVGAVGAAVTLRGLRANTTYKLTVRAVQADGTNGPGTTVRAKTKRK